MKKADKPSYDLAEIQELLKKEGSRYITKLARQGAVSLRYADDEDMVREALKIVPSDFYKTMPAEKSILMQDVYRHYDISKKLYIYIKLQISWHEKKGVIIDFKEK